MAYIGQAPTNAPLTSSDIEDGVIVAADLAPNSVDSSELVDGSIDTSHLSSSLTLTTPNLGTPSAGVVTNLSGVLPVEVTGGSGLTAIAGVTTGSGSVTITNGDLVFGTADKGICLGATSNTHANTLSDYERGGWTPVWEATTSGTITPNAGYTESWYIKIGGMIFWDFKMYINNVTSPEGKVRISGLPFAANTNVQSVFNNLRTDALSSSLEGYPSAYMDQSTSFVITDWVAGTSENAGDWANHLDSDCWMRMTGTYMAYSG